MPSATILPKGWPSDVVYLTKPSYSKAVDPLSLNLTGSPSEIAAAAAKASCMIRPSGKSQPCPSIRIAMISDPSHPACGQHGLFATRHLAPDTFVIYYLGHVHGPDEADETSNYDLCLDRELDIGVDATRMGNEARFINDYRGVRDAGPNVEFRSCWVETALTGKFEKWIGIYVLGAGKAGKRAKGIAKGEEILLSYGKGFWNHRRDES